VTADRLVTTRARFASKDGTSIPVFVLHRRDVALDGKAPTVLSGYGGFRIGRYPSWSAVSALWADLGGVHVVACLGGGDEFGETWHAAGCLANKQNVFDDFIAAADGLVAKGWVARERLAIHGGSNGGLLVAACANQRPDLCRAVVCSVPLTDMLRFHRFQFAKIWTKEYGDPELAEQCGWLRPYSPYHNVRDGAAYPAALVTAGLEDGRVNAFHARKIAARWQAATSSDRPILLSIDRDSGHGSASRKQMKADVLDRFCFLTEELGK
jgi:prolyl oligopeptidase